ncbi:MAG: winged helix-turn-helix domain-containing protein [archaeon]
MISRRTKIQIYLEILRYIKSAGGKLKKTHIVCKANLTNTRVQTYLDFLLAKGFITKDRKEDHTYFVITEKGVGFLSETKKLKEISDAFGFPLY